MSNYTYVTSNMKRLLFFYKRSFSFALYQLIIECVLQKLWYMFNKNMVYNFILVFQKLRDLLSLFFATVRVCDVI